MSDSTVAGRARTLGIRAIPAVVVNGKLAACRAGRGRMKPRYPGSFGQSSLKWLRSCKSAA
jgi:hypothetical protein